MNDMKQRLKKLITEKKITSIFFDLDGTLYSSKAGIEFEIKPQMWAVLSQRLNIPVDEAQKKLWSIIEKYDNETIGLKELGIDLNSFYYEVYNNLNLDKIESYAGLSEVLKLIKDIGITTVLLTNSSRSHAERVLTKLELRNNFDFVLGFEDNDYTRKPDRQAYLGLINKTSINPLTTIYVDDSLPNLYTAHSLGFKTIIVSNGLVEPPYFKEMHYRVKHEVPEFVDWHSYDIVNTLEQILKLYQNGN